MPDVAVEFTSADEMRALFNAFIWPRVVDGKIVEVVLASSEPSPHANQLPGTKSQTVGYFERGRLVAEAHRYLLKDGSTGGSGRPDPKMIVRDEVVLLVD